MLYFHFCQKAQIALIDAEDRYFFAVYGTGCAKHGAITADYQYHLGFIAESFRRHSVKCKRLCLFAHCQYIYILLTQKCNHLSANLYNLLFVAVDNQPDCFDFCIFYFILFYLWDCHNLSSPQCFAITIGKSDFLQIFMLHIQKQYAVRLIYHIVFQ